MRVIVTRLECEARRWVGELAARGFDAHALPLIVIAPAADAQPLRAAWQQLAGYQAVMFVSGAAVAHFFMANQPDVFEQWAHGAIKTRAWSPGPGTAAALRQAGLATAGIDSPDAAAGQFDSEALWQVVQSQVQPGCRVLIVRGGDARGQGAGRDWLARQLGAAGATVDGVVAYARQAPQFSPSQLALARQAASDGSVWLFSSSEAIAHLVQQLPAQCWGDARAVVTHPRIGEAARAAGFGVVCESRPTLDDVVASIESAR